MEKAKYTEFKGVHAQMKGIVQDSVAIRGLDEEKLAKGINIAVIEKEYDQIYVKSKLKPNVNKGEKLLLEGEVVDPCSICVNRIKKLTNGSCSDCSFESVKEISQFENPLENGTLIDYLKSIKVEKVNLRHALSSDAAIFDDRFYIEEIDLSDENIERNRLKLKENAIKAQETKKFKKEYCVSCVFQKENGSCIKSHPTYCRTNYYNTKSKLIDEVKKQINNIDEYLKLSQICGEIIKYKNVRHRISKVYDEKDKTYLLTRDYTPWDSVVVSLDEILEKNKHLESYMDIDLNEINDDVKIENAVILKLIASNWANITSISSWRNQHMFWSKFNKREEKVKIAIHLSKNVYEYSFSSLEQLTKKANRINI